VRRPVFLLAPGAGASTAHPRMLAFAEMLRELGAVHTLDYPYMTAGRKRPDPLPRLMEAHREALETARRAGGSPVILVGKSMGGRVGCHVALTEPTPAVICLGYPLCGGGDRAKLRDQVLRDLTTPTLFIQGTRDALCPLDLLNTVRADMRAQNELHVVSGGDHSLMVSKTELKRTGTTQADADHAIQIAIREFIGKTLK
jgi:predicted alpha/beta-hydrolase family hydrolase